MHADIVVIGGGVAGMSAGLAAAETGAAVRLLEPADRLGGSALLSNGSIWTFPDLDDYLTHCPGADRELAGQIVSGHGASLAWIADHDIRVVERGPSLYGAQESHQVSPRELVDGLSRTLAAAATVHTGCRARALDPGSNGVRVTTDDGRVIDADAVVVATGGIHADSETLRSAGLQRFIGLPLRNRAEGGDGARLALECGARLTGAAEGVYGHLVPVGLAPENAMSPLAAQYQSAAGVLIAPNGRLIAGEGRSDHELNRLLAGTTARRGVLIFGSEARPPGIRSAVGGTDWAGDRAAYAREKGARAESADTVGELFERIVRWGYSAGSEAHSATARLERAPYTAIEVEPSVTHVDMGIQVDSSMQAYGPHRLFVAGADIGAGFGVGYGGGLSFALTTGRVAGRAAARLTGV